MHTLLESLEKLSLNSDTITRKYVSTALCDSTLEPDECKDILRECLLSNNSMPENELDGAIDTLIEQFKSGEISVGDVQPSITSSPSPPPLLAPTACRPALPALTPSPAAKRRGLSFKDRVTPAIGLNQAWGTDAARHGSEGYCEEEMLVVEDDDNDEEEEENGKSDGDGMSYDSGTAEPPANLDEMSDEELLHSVFQFLDAKVIWNALETAGFDVEMALNILFSVDVVPKELESGPCPPSQRVCRHFMHGGCYRSDCWFSHDIRSMICRFWLIGDCMKGERCEFLHGWPTQAVQAVRKAHGLPIKQEKETKKPLLARDAPEEFPSLNSSSKTKRVAVAKSGYNDAAKIGAKARGEGTRRRSFVQGGVPYESRKFPPLPNPIPFFSTGVEVKKTYEKLRLDALASAKARNRALSLAHNAYMEGYHERAKALSQQGREANNAMREYNRRACYKMFYSRNPQLKTEAIGRLKGEVFVDFHGLHVREMYEILDDKLYELSGVVSHVWVVTGQGSHSTLRKRLYPALIKYCEEQGYRYKHYDKKGMPGLFCVLL